MQLSSSNHLIEVFDRESPLSLFKINPKQLIVDNKELQKNLLNLLYNIDSSYINDAWELINLLPKCNMMEKEIENFGNDVS